MNKSLRNSLIALGACAGIVILLAALAALALRVNAKPRLEALASRALGMDVRIGGPLTMRLFPDLRVALSDVHVRQGAVEIASAAEVDLGIAVLPLLRDEVRADQIALKRPRIAMERDRSGRLNVDTSAAASGTIPVLSVTALSASDATFSYKNDQSGAGVDAADCNLRVSHLRLSSGSIPELLKNLSFSASFGCGRVRTRDFEASDLRSSVDGQTGVITFSPITLQLFGGRGSGDVRADYSGTVPTYQIRYRLTQFRLEEFFSNVSPKSIGTGYMDFSTTLSMRGNTADTLVASTEGVATLHGNTLTLAVGDLDKELSRYESSQTFNLIDFGAFFFAGPVGLAVTKSYNYVRIFQHAEGTTSIRALASEWRVDHGVAQAADVAMATPKNRVALQGGLNFVTGRYDQVIVAVIDARGCVIVQQKVDGPFLNPTLEKPNVVGTVTGPVRTLLRQTRNLLGAKCAVFYMGAVEPSK